MNAAAMELDRRADAARSLAEGQWLAMEADRLRKAGARRILPRLTPILSLWNNERR